MPVKKLYSSLHALHLELGAKMVPFAGYELPISYTKGILGEHIHTRLKAGLFDVSHMGQVMIRGSGSAEALESLVPGDLVALPCGGMRYTQITTDSGGILDDVMVTRFDDGLFVVINANSKKTIIDLLRQQLPSNVEVDNLDSSILIALQGPRAEAVLSRHARGIEKLNFMSSAKLEIIGFPAIVSRSGYTGEDGFEISTGYDGADIITRALLGEPEVMPIGLGARDSLRMESGLCLYGNDIDLTTSPVEAALEWTISKRRRMQGGFPGEAIIQRQLLEGTTRRRVGVSPKGRIPVRQNCKLTDLNGVCIGKVTSGGYGPSVKGPIAMGYVASSHVENGTSILAMVRGKPIEATVRDLPFVLPHRMRR